MSKFCTAVRQKRQMNFLYSALLIAVLAPLAAAETTEAPATAAVAPSNSPSNTMITPDTSIFNGCEIEAVKVPTGTSSSKTGAEALEWVNKNSYDFNKRNMTVAKSNALKAKIDEQGESAFMMNRMKDPEIKKNYVETVTIRLEMTKIQDAVYKCLHANIMKNSPEDLKRLRSKDSNRATDAMPIKAIAIQMALTNRLTELQSDIMNYNKSCMEKEPTDLLFTDNQQCQDRFLRSTRAQILLGSFAQMRADIDRFSADDKVFEKSMGANVAYQNLLNNERSSPASEAAAPANTTPNSSVN